MKQWMIGGNMHNMKIVTTARVDNTSEIWGNRPNVHLVVNIDEDLLVGHGVRDPQYNEIKMCDGTDLSEWGVWTDIVNCMNKPENENYKYKSHLIKEICIDENSDPIKYEFHMAIIMELKDGIEESIRELSS